MHPIRHRWLLVPSPLLGPASWRGAAAALDRRDQVTTIAHTTMTTTGDTDHVGPWIDELLALPVPDDDLPVVVAAHSAACPRAPYAVDRLLDAGWNVIGFVCVDGRFPDGLPLTTSEPTFGSMLDGIVRPDDYLPPWPRWWGSLVVGLVVDPAAREQVFCEARPIPRDWFDQGCPVPQLPPGTGRAFLAFGPGYQASCARAEAAGWLTYLLAGDHLHQVVAPEAVADMLLSIAGDFDPGCADT